jgi:hypothetical protein
VTIILSVIIVIEMPVRRVPSSWVDDPRGKNDNIRPAQSSKTRSCGNFLTKIVLEIPLKFGIGIL